MATWNSRGLRGSTLEDLINRTNEQYAEKKLDPEDSHTDHTSPHGQRKPAYHTCLL